MRVIALCAVLAMPACGDHQRSGADRHAGLCPRVVHYDGRRYTGRIRDWRGVRVARARPLSARPGACAARYDPRPVPVWAIAGVPTSVALSPRRHFGGELYLAPGQLVVLPRHPLHRAAFGDDAHPRPPSHCIRRPSERGRVLAVTYLGEQIRLRVAGRAPLTIRLDSQTRVSGPARLAAGARARVSLRRCPGSRKPVATEIARL